MAHSGSSSHEGSRGKKVLCFCNRPPMIVKAWTDVNPGRRFYRCRCTFGKGCTFFEWYDIEKPHGWQHQALLEARDEIREQKVENERLKKLLIVRAEEQLMEVAENTYEDPQQIANNTEIMVLKREVTVMRNMFVLAWIGFAVVMGSTIAMLK